MPGWTWKLLIGIFLLSAGNLWAQSPTPCGTQLAVYRGVPAYSNGPPYHDQYTYGDCGESPGPYGDQYQCVEYVRRFYSIVYRVDISKWPDYNADQYYSHASTLGLVKYPNGSPVPPAPGDIVVFQGPSASAGHSAGHVAIVTDITSTGMDIIEQNWSLTGVAHLVLNSSGQYVRPNSNYKILGWLRLPSSIIYSSFVSGNSYDCCSAATVSGSASTPGLVDTAVSFVPSQNVYLSQIFIALTWIAGTNSAVLTLNNDNAGVPGSTIYETWDLSGLPAFPATSTIEPAQTVSSTPGILLTAGTTYWIVATAGASDSWDGWNNEIPGIVGTLAQFINGTWLVNRSDLYTPGLEVTGTTATGVP